MACIRFFTLTGGWYILSLVKFIRLVSVPSNKPQIEKHTSSLNQIFMLLVRFKQYLLDYQIKGRSDIYHICNDARFQNLGVAVNKIVGDILGFDVDESSQRTLADILRDYSRYPAKQE